MTASNFYEIAQNTAAYHVTGGFILALICVSLLIIAGTASYVFGRIKNSKKLSFVGTVILVLAAISFVALGISIFINIK